MHSHCRQWRGDEEVIPEKIFIPFLRPGSTVRVLARPSPNKLQLHHAEIQVKSEVGKGTEFVITLNNQ